MGFFGDLIGGKAGSSSANLYNNSKLRDQSNDSLSNFLQYQGNNAALDGVGGTKTATDQVQNNGITSGLFGKGGQLDQAEGHATDLANRGFSLKPEDYEAYGQASGNIARNFDTSEGNLAQSLSNRGLSNSGVAAQSFAGSQGNKQEQLGQLQMQIAQERMNTNMQRLGQMQNFVSSLGQQGENALQNQYGRQLAGEQQNFNEKSAQANSGENYLSNAQNQENNQWSQGNASKTPGMAQMFSNGLNQAVGSLPGAAMQAGMGAAMGPAAGGAMGGKKMMAGGPSDAGSAPLSSMYA